MTREYLKFNRLLVVPPLPPFLSWSYLRLAFLLFICTEKRSIFESQAFVLIP